EGVRVGVGVLERRGGGTNLVGDEAAHGYDHWMVHGRSDTTIGTHAPRRPPPRAAARPRPRHPSAPARRGPGAGSAAIADRPDRRPLAVRPGRGAGPGPGADPSVECRGDGAAHAPDPPVFPLRTLSGRGGMRHLTVTSYNIHRGVGLDRRRDLDRIAEVIAETTPDVVGLQEVIRENGVPHADQAAYIASRLGMSEIVMGETRAHGAGTYGNVVLTKLPVLGSGRCDLSCGPREPRGCLRVDLDIEGAPVHVFNCHFGLALSERRAQL